MKIIKITFIISIAISSALYSNQEIFDFHNIRQKAMGGTKVTTVKNASHFYQNPAILASENKFKLALPKFGYGINKALLEKMTEINNVSNGSNTEKQINALKDLVPLKAATTIDMYPILGFTTKKLGNTSLGLTSYAKGHLNGDLKKKTSPILYLEGNINATIQVGIARTLTVNNQDIHVGISPKYSYKGIFYNKETGENTYKMTQTELIKIANGLESFNPHMYMLSGFGLDIGALYPYSIEQGLTSMYGTIGISIQNIISSLSGDQDIIVNDVSETKKIKTNDPIIITLGNTFNYKAPIIKNVEISTDYNIIAPTESILKRFHFGLEKKVGPIIALRGGLNQGFIVGGFGINLFMIKLDYAYFTEEISESIGKNTVESHNIQFGLLF